MEVSSATAAAGVNVNQMVQAAGDAKMQEVKKILAYNAQQQGQADQATLDAVVVGSVDVYA